MKPRVHFLEEELIDRIVAEAKTVLAEIGVETEDDDTKALLTGHGARVEATDGRVRIPTDVVEGAVATAPSSFKLFDVMGDETHDFSGEATHFTPASSAIMILDETTGKARTPRTADYIRYAKVVAGLPSIHAQSTAFIPADVDERVSDSYRLFLSLLTCEKPVVTGAFSVESFAVMNDLPQHHQAGGGP